MKVLFIHAALNGLPAEYTVHATLAANAVALGVESSFLWQGPVDQSVLATAGLDAVTVRDFGRNFTISPKPSKQRRAWLMASRFPASLAAVKRTIERVRPDIVYSSQQQMDLCLAQLCTRRLDIPHVVHLHYSIGPWIGATAVRIINQVPHKFAVSEYVRQTAMLRGSTPESVTTILNPLPFTHANVDGDDRARVRASLGISAEAPLVVAAGRLDPGKGHLALLDAFNLVLDRVPEARLLICGIAGSEDYGHALRRRAEDLGVDRSTIFAGWRGDMPQIYRAADVFCLPSEMEPYGLVYLEAMSAGLPVVAVYSGGTPELVEHGRTGLLAYPKDPVALACHLTRLLCDRALARDFGTAGRQRVQRDFDSRAIAQRWVNLLADVA